MTSPSVCEMPLPEKDDPSTAAPAAIYIGPSNQLAPLNAFSSIVCTAPMPEIFASPLDSNAEAPISVTPPMLIDVRAAQSLKVLSFTTLLANRPGKVTDQAALLERVVSNASHVRLGQP